jgi:hypothetical protein
VFTIGNIDFANSQVKVGKPPSINLKAGKPALRYYRINQKVKNLFTEIQRNAHENQIDFSIKDVISLSTYMYFENFIPIALDRCVSTHENHQLNELTKKTRILISGKALDLLKEISKNEKLFVNYTTSTFGITHEQATNILNQYKIIINLSEQ